MVLGCGTLVFANYLPQLLEPNAVAQAPERDDGDVSPYRFEFYERLKEPWPTPETAPVAPLDDSQPEHYLVQAGSFRRRADAQRLSAKLLLVELPAEVHAVDLDDGTWHRVTVGPFPSRQATQRALSKLRSMAVTGLVLAKPGRAPEVRLGAVDPGEGP